MQKTARKKDKDPCEAAGAAAGRVNVVAQELKFAKMLASNDVKIRNNVLKSLKKWLSTRSQSSYRKYLLIALVFVTILHRLSTNNDIQLRGNPALFTKIFILKISFRLPLSVP
jgi:hypothetical protein